MSHTGLRHNQNTRRISAIDTTGRVTVLPTYRPPGKQFPSPGGGGGWGGPPRPFLFHHFMVAAGISRALVRIPTAGAGGAELQQLCGCAAGFRRLLPARRWRGKNRWLIPIGQQPPTTCALRNQARTLLTGGLARPPILRFIFST